MTGRYTPGPWEFASINFGFQEDASMVQCNKDILAPPSGEHGVRNRIATVFQQHENHKADGRLLAAAPELLEALEQMRDMTRDGWILPEGMSIAWERGWAAACYQFKLGRANEVADAAIRKAKGEEEREEAHTLAARMVHLEGDFSEAADQAITPATEQAMRVRVDVRVEAEPDDYQFGSSGSLNFSETMSLQGAGFTSVATVFERCHELLETVKREHQPTRADGRKP